MMDMFSALVVVMVSLVYAYVQTHPDVNIKCVQFLYSNYTSIKQQYQKKICILFKCTEVLILILMSDGHRGSELIEFSKNLKLS